MQQKINLNKLAKDVILQESKSLEIAAKNIDLSFEKAVMMINDCNGNVIVMGMGKSGIIARKISSTLLFIGCSSIFVNPADAMHGDIGLIKKKDVIMIVTYGGETSEIINLIPYIKTHSNKIIVLTSQPQSTLGKIADVIVNISIDHEACPFNLIPSTSTTITSAIGDAIIFCLLKLKRIKVNDLLERHIGGSIGLKSDI